MSRIGNNPIIVPDKVQVSFEGNVIKVKGPKGEMEQVLPEEITYTFENNTIQFSRPNDEKRFRSLHGLTRALASNAVTGVSEGFAKNLQIEGVGFKAEMRGKKLMLSLGFSHPILFIPPDGIEFIVPNPNRIEVTGINKQLVGECAAKIRKLRPPEPYKGKGIRYEGEYVRRKAGKTAA